MKKQPLKSVWPLVCLAAISVVSSGCSNLGLTTVQKTESRSASFSESSVLSARTANGTVTVERAEERVLAVDATIRARDEDRLQAVQLIVRESTDGAYEVFVEWPNGEIRQGEGADLKIRVPGASDIELTSSNGALRIEGLNAAVKATTTNGVIHISGPARRVNAATTNGNITLESIAGEVQARSTNGRVRASLAPENPGPVKLTSTNGSITLFVGPSFAGQVSVRTSNGQIALGDFGPNEAPSVLKHERRIAQFGFGDASSGSSLTTTNGNVTIAPITE